VVVGLRNPRAQVCRCFVGEPLLQNGGIALVVGETKLRNLTSHYEARFRGVL
jgi:hypothetical protein